MDKNLYYPIISLVLVVLVAGAVYMLAGMFGGTEIHGEEHGENHGEAHGAEAEELFFEAIANPLAHNEYVYAYEETSSNGYKSSVFLTASENYTYVKKEDAISTRELFSRGNETILCIENVNRKLCAEVSQNSSFKPYAHTLSGLLLDRETILKTQEANELLVQYGAVSFGNEIQEAQYMGRECSEISYTLDYSKLTVEQMWQLGMSPESPEVLVSKEFNFTLCIDAENGDVLHKFLSYSVFGEQYSTESLTTIIKWDMHSGVEFPDEFSSEEDMETFFSALKMSQENYRQCLSEEDTDMCIRGEAILSRNERLCELVLNTTSRDICYVNVALEKGDSTLCEMASGENYDGCLIEFAYKYLDASFCENISASRMEECTSIIEEGLAQGLPGEESGNETAGEEPGESPEPSNEGVQEPSEGEPGTEYGSECTVDSDCTVATECRYQCVPSFWSDVAMTCEYEEEYECLEFTSCGCMEGRCSWAENEEYSSCLSQIE